MSYKPGVPEGKFSVREVDNTHLFLQMIKEKKLNELYYTHKPAKAGHAGQKGE